MTTVTAFQPQPFPRLYLLDRARQADVVVLMTSAQFTAKNGEGGGPSGQKHFWYAADPRRGPLKVQETVRVRSHSSRCPIEKVELAAGDGWVQDVEQRFRRCYRHAPCGNDVATMVGDWLRGSYTLSDLGQGTFEEALDEVGVHGADLLTDEQVTPHTHSGSEWILQLCLALHAKRYLCGAPSLHYLDLDAFYRYGVEVVVQQWQPKPYRDGWLPNLSYLDAMAYGLHGARAILG